MRKVILALLCACLLCGGCSSALPAEERSFAVALGVSASAGVWEVAARIPTYQQEGGYLTLSAQGATLAEALSLLDAAAPMRMHYGQTRLLVISQGLAEASDFPGVLQALARLRDMRLQAQVCVTADDLPTFMDALEPQTGTRLSKSLDILLQTRRELGVVPDATLSSVLRMGERQCPVLLAAALSGEESVSRQGMDATPERQRVQSAGEIRFGGGWLVSAAGQVKGSLSPRETQLLNLLQGRTMRSSLAMEDGAVTLADAGCKVRLDGNTVFCDVTLRYTDATLSKEGVIRELSEDIRGVTAKLSAADCDALGLGRQAVRHFVDVAAWKALDWPGLYPRLQWQITVRLNTVT